MNPRPLTWHVIAPVTHSPHNPARQPDHQGCHKQGRLPCASCRFGPRDRRWPGSCAPVRPASRSALPSRHRNQLLRSRRSTCRGRAPHPLSASRRRQGATAPRPRRETNQRPGPDLLVLNPGRDGADDEPRHGEDCYEYSFRDLGVDSRVDRRSPGCTSDRRLFRSQAGPLRARNGRLEHDRSQLRGYADRDDPSNHAALYRRWEYCVCGRCWGWKVRKGGRAFRG
jgi:hypothetical protein